MKRRWLLRERADRDKAAQALVLKACSHDISIFVNDWIWTFDQRNIAIDLPADVPLVLRPRQTAFLRWLDDRVKTRENGLVEKSRDEGATYMVCAYGLWRWLFTEGFKMGIGSRKLELVDQLDNMDAIFPKIRYMLQGLPEWMQPPRYDVRKHDNHTRIYNPHTRSLFSGEGGNEIGRGGRSTMYLVDEHSYLPKAQLADNALSNNTNTIIYVGTPNGTANLFYTKRMSQKVPIFTFFWKDNPDKNFTTEWLSPLTNETEQVYPWYVEQTAKYDPITIAQEIDLDYSASMEGVFIPGKWVQAAVDLDLPMGTRRYAALDVGEGHDENVYGCRRGPVLARMIPWLSDNTVETAHRCIRYCQSDEVTHFRFDRWPSGVGGTLKLRSSKLREEKKKLGFTYEPYNAGAPASFIFYSDEPRVTANERFVNRKAEDMWALRLRFYRTWQYVQGIGNHPLDDLISIPNDPTLIAQCSVTRYFQTETGKVRSESKKELKTRGVGSPDRFEMLYILFSARHVPTAPTTAIRSFN